MFKRKIIDDMIDWKESGLSKKKAYVIKGLRQVGKTYIATYFADTYYKSTIYLNFKSQPSLKDIFSGDLDVDRIMLDISAKMPRTKILPHDTVLIFDEIQECSNARISIKPFIEDGRYDVICTGSLLGIKGYNRRYSKGVPIGYEHIYYLKSMDFEEFLWAKGIDEKIISNIRSSFSDKKRVSDTIHQSMMRYYREYICVGGMPHVVDTFLSTGDMNVVYREQRELIDEFKDDFGKHLDDDENEQIDETLLSRIENVFDSIPSQLAKENKKFQYSLMKKNGRASEYLPAIQWLCDYGLVELCHNLSILQTPLEGNKEDDVFKIYVQDCGLFTAMLEKGSAADILCGDMGIYKGAVYEDIIADAFIKNERALYYYRRESKLEIDFVTRVDNKICLVEVKSSTGNTKSSRTILENKDTYGVEQCIKFGDYNVGQNKSILTLPYYMAFLLDDAASMRSSDD